MIRPRFMMALAIVAALLASPALADSVRVKDLGRFLGWRENALVGYGIMVGLSGSGDSSRSAMTQHALANALSRLGTTISPDQIQSRNVAAVMVTAALPPSAKVGDKIDISVSSIGDARSLVGGTLLLTPLSGPDQRVYALAEGSVVVGGYRFDSSANREQENYPTSGVLPHGGTVEIGVSADLVGQNGQLTFVLSDPDVITAVRIKDGIDAILGPGAARVDDASAVSINSGFARGDLYRLIARVEDVRVSPDPSAVVVVNERTGTVVSGGGVQISDVVISQGDIRVSVSLQNDGIDGALFPARASGGGRGRMLTVTNTKLEVSQPKDDAVVRFPNTTVADLVTGLARAHIDTRGMIAILQAMKAAGALHADIVVQ
jgi:flagellar P-ring protein precursor FlgI